MSHLLWLTPFKMVILSTEYRQYMPIQLFYHCQHYYWNKMVKTNETLPLFSNYEHVVNLKSICVRCINIWFDTDTLTQLDTGWFIVRQSLGTNGKATEVISKGRWTKLNPRSDGSIQYSKIFTVKTDLSFWLIRPARTDGWWWHSIAGEFKVSNNLLVFATKLRF